MDVRSFTSTDREALRGLLDHTPEFAHDEVTVAMELADEVAGDSETTYRATVATRDGELCGWLCYGATPMTESTFDLYWIVVASSARGLGVGRALHDDMVRRIRDQGGKRVRAETSTSEASGAPLRFYVLLGYEEVGRIRDFYEPGDDLITSLFELAPTT